LREIVAFVDFRSTESLESVEVQISEHLFGGISFGGREESLRDEVPALRMMRDVLGLRVIVHGYAGAEGHTVEVEARPSVVKGVPPDQREVVGLSEFVARQQAKVTKPLQAAFDDPESPLVRRDLELRRKRDE